MQIFISYRRDDSSYAAGRLFDKLTQHFTSDRIFMDIDGIELGVDFGSRIDEAISDCDVVIALIGRNWIDAADAAGRRRLEDEGDFVRLELSAALKRNINVIPALIDGASMPTKQQLPEALHALARRNGLEIGHSQFHSDVALLINGLEGIFAKKRNVQPAVIATDPNTHAARDRTGAAQVVEKPKGGAGPSKDTPVDGRPRWKFGPQAGSIWMVLALAVGTYLLAITISNFHALGQVRHTITGLIFLAFALACPKYLLKLRKRGHFLAVTLGTIAVLGWGILSMLVFFG